MTVHYNRRMELTKRRGLRRRSTAAERRLWLALRAGQLGVRFRRQYSVDAFVLDFYAAQCRLAIEVDGDAHCTPDAIEYDEERTRYLERFGIEVVRVSNLDVTENLEGVLEQIQRAVEQRLDLSRCTSTNATH